MSEGADPPTVPNASLSRVFDALARTRTSDFFCHLRAVDVASGLSAACNFSLRRLPRSAARTPQRMRHA
jgi:hypothetical protein